MFNSVDSLWLWLSNAAAKCVFAQVWNWWKVLAYCAQLNNIFSCTHASNCNWDIWAEEAPSCIRLNLAAPCIYTSVQWVLPKTVSTNFPCLSCRGNFAQIFYSFLFFFYKCVNERKFPEFIMNLMISSILKL